MTDSRRISLNKNLSEAISQLSSGFIKLSEKSSDEEVKELIDDLFKKLISLNRKLAAEVNELSDDYEKLFRQIEALTEEKRKLEVLYSSGILFVSEVEKKNLMQKAIDTVVKELKADKGFILLKDQTSDSDMLATYDFEISQETTARELSQSVIDATINSLKPLQINNLNSEKEFAKKSSVISLGLSAVLCVPLVSNSKVYGVVYVDRRGKEKPFSNDDLSFLVSFSKQIVKGIEISDDISMLEDSIVSETKENFKELRNQFKCDEIIGISKKLFNSLKLAFQVSDTDASVIILGENGTGKDLLAKAVHCNSQRSSHPFVAINCGAIPNELLESELFGYESGAFTGATKSKPGKLEIADGGTVFLDEIAEMSPNLQAKLLRVIQTKEIERLGSISNRKIDVRFIAATNKNLQELVESHEFRDDLYYRLHVIEIKIPSLRDRKEDIELLANYFAEKYSKNGKVIITPEALDILEYYDWPGNIRELENVIQRSIILSKNNLITAEHMPPEIIAETPLIENDSGIKALSEAENDFRRMYIQKVLRKTESKSEAAKTLGINRTHLYKLLSQLNIDV